MMSDRRWNSCFNVDERPATKTKVMCTTNVNVVRIVCSKCLTLLPPFSSAALSPMVTLLVPPRSVLRLGLLSSDCRSPCALATMRTPLLGKAHQPQQTTHSNKVNVVLLRSLVKMCKVACTLTSVVGLGQSTFLVLNSAPPPLKCIHHSH